MLINELRRKLLLRASKLDLVHRVRRVAVLNLVRKQRVQGRRRGLVRMLAVPAAVPRDPERADREQQFL